MREGFGADSASTDPSMLAASIPQKTKTVKTFRLITFVHRIVTRIVLATLQILQAVAFRKSKFH